MWVRLPLRALLKASPPQADRGIESLFSSLVGDLRVARTVPCWAGSGFLPSWGFEQAPRSYYL